MNAPARQEMSRTSAGALDVNAMRSRPDPERIAFVREGVWIPYARADEILSELEFVLTQPPSPRMTGLTIVGPTNNGKSSLLRRFIERVGTGPATAEAERYDFVHVDAPPVPSLSALWTAILRRIGDVRADKGTITQKEVRLINLLPQVHTRMLIIDEIHNVSAGTGKQPSAFLNALKYLSNHLAIPVVLCGTNNAHDVLKLDDQVLNRYPAVELPEWPLDDYIQLVKRGLSVLPLRERPAITMDAIRALHPKANTLGALIQRLQRAAVRAIESGNDQLTADLLLADLRSARR